MKRISKVPGLVLLLAAILPAQRPWQQITVPTVREAAASFKTPPREYGAIQPFASWNGPDARERMERIVADLDRLAANGVFVVNLSPGRGEPKYLSPEHIDQVKFVVREAARRGMKLWLQDEYDYPSGFAGGKISEPASDHAGSRRRHTDQCDARPDPDDAGAAGHFGRSGGVCLHGRHSACGDRPQGNPVEGPGATSRRGRLPKAVGTDPHPAYVSQFSDPHVEQSRRHARQRQPVFADRLPESGGHPRVSQDHARGLQGGGRRRVWQDRSGLLRRRTRLHRLHAMDAQAAGGVPPTEGLRSPAAPAASIRP